MPKLWRAPIPMVRITAPQITGIQKLSLEVFTNLLSLDTRSGSPPPARSITTSSVHDHLGGERIDGHRTLPPQLRQQGKLRGSQPARCQQLVVELGHVPGNLANRQADALRRGGSASRRHHRIFLLTNVYMRLYLPMSIRAHAPSFAALLRHPFRPSSGWPARSRNGMYVASI